MSNETMMKLDELKKWALKQTRWKNDLKDEDDEERHYIDLVHLLEKIDVMIAAEQEDLEQMAKHYEKEAPITIKKKVKQPIREALKENYLDMIQEFTEERAMGNNTDDLEITIRELEKTMKALGVEF